eukprot:TRINITY_DN1212_c0_g5_i2.p1 TRINITY_DN1212_c0_g5~~TRINITY_DN1212_c0_g5_i2.p1  ORF type:complete len:929 (-),score=291.48 TRINITY_DN1212_c0_g5_i2:56-2842(-)
MCIRDSPKTPKKEGSAVEILEGKCRCCTNLIADSPNCRYKSNSLVFMQNLSQFIIMKLILLLFAFALADNPYQVDIQSIKRSDYKWTMNLIHNGQDKNNTPIMKAFASIESLDASVLHLKIVDASERRWEAPLLNPDAGKNYRRVSLNSMGVSLNYSPFGLRATDPKTGQLVVDTFGKSLLFKDKYLEITMKYATQGYFGLGERVTADFFLCSGRDYCWYTMWGKDVASPLDDGAGGCKGDYGQQPFYMMQLPNTKQFTGVFILNSNDQDVHIQKNDDGSSDLTHRLVGGVFDIYFFYPGTAEFVMRTYHELIGRPYLPPLWSLGYHQCRYGWPSLVKVKDVVQKFKQNDLPLDVVWADIDYMKDYADFSVDPVRYAGLKEFVQDLHRQHMRWVPIIDAGIKKSLDDKYYKLGEELGAFIKSAHTGKTLVGKVWPGLAVFLSWYSPHANTVWWTGLKDLYQLVEYDGIWIDMNEIANFCNGECKEGETTKNLRTSLGKNQHDPHEFDNIPYRPGNCDLNEKTVSMTGYHFSEDEFGDRVRKEYNTHSLWNLYEAKSTHEFLAEHLKTRPFVLTRSNFPGSGLFTTKWLGDNFSTWEYMRYSIAGMYNYQMFGIPLIGADMCGFVGNTNEELCARWMQLGAFYPFTRNHNAIGTIDQEPYVFGQRVIIATRNAMRQKYSLIRYYYTKLFEVSLYGGSLIRPLFFEFPHDAGVYSKTNYMFMIGSSLLVSPVLHPGIDKSYPYCPNEDWYDLRSFAKVYSYKPGTQHGERITIPGGFDFVPVLIRGGSVVPFQDASLANNIETMKNLPTNLLIVPDHSGYASGTIVTDDGVSLDTIKDKKYRHLAFDFSMNEKRLMVRVLNDYDGKPNNEERVMSITVFGADKLADKLSLCAITLNGRTIEMSGSFNSVTRGITYRVKNCLLYTSDAADE